MTSIERAAAAELLTIDNLIAFRKNLWAELDAVCISKGADYSGKKGDTFKNIRSCEAFGLPAEVGIMVRIGDKYNRAFELLMREYTSGDGPQVANEKVEDTIKDAINYLSYILAIRKAKSSAATATTTEGSK